MEQQSAARKFAIMSVQTKTKCGNKKASARMIWVWVGQIAANATCHAE
jgi:hypothetical protein